MKRMKPAKNKKINNSKRRCDTCIKLMKISCYCNFITKDFIEIIGRDEYNSKFLYIPKGSPYEAKFVHRCGKPQPCDCVKMMTMEEAGITAKVCNKGDCTCQE